LKTSLTLQLFSLEEVKNMHPENILLLSLIECGNSLDSILVASKILRTLNLEDELEKTEDSSNNVAGALLAINAQTSYPKATPVKKQINSNFSKLQNWKKRKCHCCMVPILDAGKAVACVNIIRQDNPCINLYCQNCAVNFISDKYNFNYHINDEFIDFFFNNTETTENQ